MRRKAAMNFQRKSMDNLKLETERLILRKFEPTDMQALYLLLSDREVNTFLPWYPVKNLEQTEEFYNKRFADKKNIALQFVSSRIIYLSAM